MSPRDSLLYTQTPPPPIYYTKKPNKWVPIRDHFGEWGGGGGWASGVGRLMWRDGLYVKTNRPVSADEQWSIRAKKQQGQLAVLILRLDAVGVLVLMYLHRPLVWATRLLDRRSAWRVQHWVNALFMGCTTRSIWSAVKLNPTSSDCTVLLYFKYKYLKVT